MSLPIENARTLVSSRSSIQLASVDESGNPLASYAPYLLDSGHIYIYISSLARHAGNIHATPQVSLMFIQDENQTRNIFARQRLELSCVREVVAPDDDSHERTLDMLQEKHGETVALLRSLPDFTLFRLAPRAGNYVEGFGRAWELGEAELGLVFGG